MFILDGCLSLPGSGLVRQLKPDRWLPLVVAVYTMSHASNFQPMTLPKSFLLLAFDTLDFIPTSFPSLQHFQLKSLHH